MESIETWLEEKQSKGETEACPFCATRELEYHTDGSACGFRCLGCGAMSGMTPNKEEALKLWNTRTAYRRLEQRVKVLEESLKAALPSLPSSESLPPSYQETAIGFRLSKPERKRRESDDTST
jgi:hypothetical protein